MTNTNETQTREEIAGIRRKFAILRAICGPRGISQETIQEYGKRIQQLEAELETNSLKSAGRGRQTTANAKEEEQNE